MRERSVRAAFKLEWHSLGEAKLARDRAVNEYNHAIRTKDNTQNAQEEAAKYLKAPYERKRNNI
jgi:hypothetical protein